MTLSELAALDAAERKQHALQMPSLDPKRMWHLDYYDGPISFIVELDGKPMYAERLDIDEAFYFVVELSEKEASDEYYWHELFRMHVGYHTDYGDLGTRTLGAHSQNTKEYYELAKNRPQTDYTNRPVVGVADWYGDLRKDA